MTKNHILPYAENVDKITEELERNLMVDEKPNKRILQEDIKPVMNTQQDIKPIIHDTKEISGKMQMIPGLEI